MLLYMAAQIVLPDEAEWEGKAQERIPCYVQRRCRLSLRCGSWDPAYPPALQPLGGLLLRCCAGMLLRKDPRQAIACPTVLNGAIGTLAQPPVRTVVSRQLRRAEFAAPEAAAAASGAPGQLLTVEQLEVAVHDAVASVASIHAEEEFGARLLPRWSLPRLSAGERALFADAAITSSERLLQLEPAHPLALIRAASSVPCRVQPTEHQGAFADRTSLRQRALSLFLRAFRAAETRHDAFSAAIAACQVVARAIGGHAPISRADLAAMLAVARKAPATAKRLSRMLPQPWTAALDAAYSITRPALTAAEAWLAGRPEAVAAAEAAVAAVSAAGPADALDCCTCNGCGRVAMGLRHCARCRQVACELLGWQAPGCQRAAAAALRQCKAALGAQGARAPACGWQGRGAASGWAHGLGPHTALQPACFFPADCSRECQVAAAVGGVGVACLCSGSITCAATLTEQTYLSVYR